MSTRKVAKLDDRPMANRIIEEAAVLFYRKGYPKTSMSDVADAVQLLKGSLYYYIDSKDDLLFRILQDVRAKSLELIDEVSQRDDLTAVQKLHHYVALNVAYNCNNVYKGAIYYREFQFLAQDRQTYLGDKDSIYEDFVADLVRLAQEEGEIDMGLEPRLFVKYVFAVTNSVFNWYKPGGRLTPEALGESYASMVLYGVAKQPRRPRSSRGRGAKPATTSIE